MSARGPRRGTPLAIETGLTALITGSGDVHRAQDGVWHVPKRELVRAVLTGLESGRLRIAGSLALVPALMRELRAFKALIGRKGHAKFEGVGEHDDLVIALAVAVWWLGVGSMLVSPPRASPLAGDNAGPSVPVVRKQ
jgi:hypothetical protein